MEFLDITETFRRLCLSEHKWGLFLSLRGFMDDVTLAAPYLALGFQGGAFDSSICQIQVDGYGILLFETEDEVNRYYDMTVGDDGPTQSNPYNGPVRIYALTCSDRGILMRENT